MLWRRLGRRPVTRGEGPPSPGCRGRSGPLGTRPRPLLLPQSGGGGARRLGPRGCVLDPAWTGRSRGLAPAHPASDRVAQARRGQNAILFGWHALDGDFFRPLSLCRQRREAWRVCFHLTTVAFFITHCWALPLRKELSPGTVLVGFSSRSDERVSGSQIILEVGRSLPDLTTATKHRAPW